jgi:hypothetical protein
MIIESIVLSITVVFVSSLRFARKLISDEKSAELQVEKEIRDQESKEEAEQWKAAQQRADYEFLKADPALCKARLQSIYEKRKFILSEIDRMDTATNRENLFAALGRERVKLFDLAEEEGNIPLLEGEEEFVKSLQAQQVEPPKVSTSRSNKVKRDALERERNLMEGLVVNSAYIEERNSARNRLKEITEQLSKLVD